LKGSPQFELYKYEPSLYSHNQVYLDNRTGDFWNVKDAKWELGGNVGLHQINALGDEVKIVQKTKEYIKKPQKYQPII
jgi:hypothetical protein